MDNVKVGNSRYIHSLNQSSIFRLIHQYGPVSRKELAENTGYSAATISNHVKKLIEKGFVIETEKGISTGGRKPVYLTVNPDAGYIISINIEVRQVRIVLFNLKLEIEVDKLLPIQEDEKPDKTIKKIIKEIKRITVKNNVYTEDILGIGIAVPGLIDKDKSSLKFAPNLGWREISIINEFQDKYPFPIVLENEANAAVIGEKEFNFPDASNLVYVSINEGIGCGIIFNDELYRGASGNAGEFGHIIIDSDGPLCHCGNHGCWETLASEQYIVNEFEKMSGQKVRKEEIYSLGETGDEKTIKIFKDVGKHIGIGLVNIVNSLSPELLIIGGNISKIKKYIYKDVKKIVKKEALKISYDKVDIKFSCLKNLAPVYGLAKVVFDRSLELK